MALGPRGEPSWLTWAKCHDHGGTGLTDEVAALGVQVLAGPDAEAHPVFAL